MNKPIDLYSPNDSLIGMIGVSSHYFKSFIETLLPDDGYFFHTIIGIVRNKPEYTAGKCYIFTGGPKSGKTSLAIILRKVFADNPHVIIVDDIDPNKLTIYPTKTYFIMTNLLKDEIAIPKSTIFVMKKTPFSKRHYDIFMHDFDIFNDTYKYICDMEYHEWNRAFEIRNNL